MALTTWKYSEVHYKKYVYQNNNYSLLTPKKIILKIVDKARERCNYGISDNSMKNLSLASGI